MLVHVSPNIGAIIGCLSMCTDTLALRCKIVVDLFQLAICARKIHIFILFYICIEFILAQINLKPPQLF